MGELAKAIADNFYRGGSNQDVIDEAIQAATLCLRIARMYKIKQENEGKK